MYKHYKIKLNNPETRRDIEYEQFDYNIIKPNITPFADTLVNEMWPFFRQLWRMRGGYEAEVYFNPEIDLKEFGNQALEKTREIEQAYDQEDEEMLIRLIKIRKSLWT